MDLWLLRSNSRQAACAWKAVSFSLGTALQTKGVRQAFYIRVCLCHAFDMPWWSMRGAAIPSHTGMQRQHHGSRAAPYQAPLLLVAL